MIFEPNCRVRRCKHYQGIVKPNGPSEVGEVACCRAFPAGIPEEIAYGDEQHILPVDGDGGVTFEFLVNVSR